MRIEKDYIGEKQIADNVLYGIHSARARENFPDVTPFHIEWYKAVGVTKLACYQTYKSFKKAVAAKYNENESPISFFNDEVIDKLIVSAEKVSKGEYFEHFIVPAVQGGAGTSINLNVNEIIANATLLELGNKVGEYQLVDPIEHANIYQSTNDVIPTALTVAAIQLLVELEEHINKLRFRVEELEKENRDVLRIGYTQMQAAVPSSFGKLFSTYNDALSRDWWRVSKCFERIKVVNLGGSAIGTALGVPRYFVMEVVGNLQRITNLPLTRSENLCDATNNLDKFVEVHATLKAHAVNLEKIVSDLRLLASDIVGNKEITLPQKQVGSSIMPAKINPVIPEFVVSVAHKIYANDMLISSLSAQGCLELNAYLPVIGHALLDSLKLLIAADKTLLTNLFAEIQINQTNATEKLYRSASITTALTPYIGYNKASLLAKEMKRSGTDIFEANRTLKLIDQLKLETILQPQNLLKTGFSMNDLV